MADKRRWGIALPAILMVVSIVVLVGGAMISISTMGLRAADKDALSEKALYAAEAGLSRAAQSLVDNNGVLAQPFTGALPSSECTWNVTMYKNTSGNPMVTPGGPTIPPNSILLMSKGLTRGKVERSSWALFKTGLGQFQVGALADQFGATNSTFDAFDSTTGQPIGGAGIMASNRNSGLTYQLTDSHVKGNAFVGPNGSTTLQFDMIGNSTVQRSGVMANTIAKPVITVPNLPAADASPGASPTPAATPPPFNFTSNPAYDMAMDSQGNLTITKNCLTCHIAADGTFWADESGNPGHTLTGNVYTGPDQNDPDWTVTMAPNFQVQGKWHTVGIDFANQKWGHDQSTGVANTPYAPNYESTPAWVWDFFHPAPTAVNPSTLAGGRYDTVEINSGLTHLQPNSEYVIKNLTIKNGGQLHLPSGVGNVSIYVTGKLSVLGKDALLNDTLKAPLLKMFYTGVQDVDMSSGAKSYATLMAPDAQVKLTGSGSTFYGALVAKSVNLVDSQFFYDKATNGVGTGTDATTVYCLARYRP